MAYLSQNQQIKNKIQDRGVIEMKKRIKKISWCIAILWIVAVVLVLTGCFSSHQIREYSQSQIANDPILRSGSPVLFVNRWEATSAEVHLFRGNLTRNEILTNVNGQLAIVTDKRIMKFALEPAFSDRDPAKKEILLDSSRAYTALIIVRGGGKAIKGPIYSVSHYSVRTSGDALRDSRSGLQRYGTVYANRIIEVNGTNTSVIDKLDLHMLFFPNQVVRDWLRR